MGYLYLCLFQISVSVCVPVVGEYGLEVYASEAPRDGDVFTHVSQYLVVFHTVSSQQLLERPSPALGVDVNRSSIFLLYQSINQLIY